MQGHDDTPLSRAIVFIGYVMWGGVGIRGDILYGPTQVRELVRLALEAGVGASYREIRSTKGHDAFLVEWPQLAPILDEGLRHGVQAVPPYPTSRAGVSSSGGNGVRPVPRRAESGLEDNQ